MIHSRPTSSDATRLGSRRLPAVLAVTAGIGWFWAFSLLAIREHWVLSYFVVPSEPPAWGFLALPYTTIVVISCIAGILASGCIYHGHSRPAVWSSPTYWLLTAHAIPLLDIMRCVGVSIPTTFLEPLWLSFVTGVAVAEILRSAQWPDRLDRVSSPRVWLTAVWVLTVGAVMWWYLQGQWAFDDYLLGYHDFGHFARRVVNTWEGRGFLKETPSLPAFWDHFNPGLGLLAPLWGAWPNARLFILLQAVCLAAPIPLVFGIARAWGASAAAAAVWAAAYVAHPAIGQLNLNASYGWHPVSLALPLMFASVWLLLRRHRVSAAVAAILACSFKETVVVAFACLAAVLAFQAWWTRRRDSPSQDTVFSDGLLASRLPIWGWVSVWAASSIAFVLIFKLAAFSEFQTDRFSTLGDSAVEILLAPALRPSVFWGQILRPESAWFVLALLVPFGLPTIVRGWPVLLGVIPPIGVVLAWEHRAASCIAFQYITTLIPFFTIAAVAGAAGLVGNSTPPFHRRRAGLSVWDSIFNLSSPPEDDARTTRSSADSASHHVASASCVFLVAGLSALAAGLTASTCLGCLPWSAPTLTNVLEHTYRRANQSIGDNPRAVGTEAGAALSQIVSMVGDEDAAVLASGRIAAHLLGVRRLEAVEQAVVRWEALCDEAGEGRSGVEVFDWIVLDTSEGVQQSADKMHFFIQEAKDAGFHVERSSHGILVFAKPDGP